MTGTVGRHDRSWSCSADEFSGRVRVPAVPGIDTNASTRFASGFPILRDGHYITEIGEFMTIKPRLIETASGDLHMAT